MPGIKPKKKIENKKAKKTTKTARKAINVKGAPSIQHAPEANLVFGKGITFKAPLVSETIKMYLANRRKGLASTKTRGEVSGGGKKPWKQKGTGRARVGSIRSPLWRHGGIVFGPHPRSYSYSLPQSKRVGALISALGQKDSCGQIVVIGGLNLGAPKTKELASELNKLKVEGKALLIIKKNERDIRLASRNIPYLTVRPAGLVNALDVLPNNKIIILKDALEELQKRLT